MTEPQPLVLTIKPSVLLKQSLIALHGLALLACWLSAVTVLVQVVLTLVIGFNLQKIMRAKVMAEQTCYLQYSTGLGWQLSKNNNDYQMITLLPSTVVSAYLTVIHYQSTTQSWQSLVIMRDSLSPEQYRQLIVQLKVTGSK